MSVHVSDRLSAYLDGELSVVDAGDVRQHLATCDACSAELLELITVDRAVRELPVTAPEGYFDGFATRVRTRIESSGRARGGSGLPRWTWALAAALLLAVVLPRMPWDRTASPARPAAKPPAASLPADKDARLETDSFAQARPTVGPATSPPPPASAREARDEQRDLRRREPGRSDVKPPTSVEDQPKADVLASPGKAREQYAEPPPEGATFSTTPARVAPMQRPEAPPPPASAPAAAAPPYTGAAPAQAAEEKTQKLEAEVGLRDEAVVEEEVAVEEPHAKRQLEKKGEDAFASLDSSEARSLEERRALREASRKLANTHPEDPQADMARVRVVTLGAEIARATAKPEDLAQLRADAAAYLARADARQKERVRALLAEFDR
jgi:Putative zinc-finger